MKTPFLATMLLVIFAASLYGQSGSINNTLGTNGLFTIRDNSRTFLTLSQSTGVLNFASTLGDKISLWGSSGPHYGFGIQYTQLQIHTDEVGSDVVFGYGTSGAFTETMRIKGNGILQFPPALAKKITLYPGGSGDAGFGVFGNELRIASDYSGADITFGFDNRISGFTEKFRMRANGSLMINGNAGQTGQVLASTGGGANTWVDKKEPSFYTFKQNDYQLLLNSNDHSPGEPTGWYVMGGLHNQEIIITKTSTVFLQVRVPVYNSANAFGGIGESALYLGLYDAASNYIGFDIIYCYVPDGGLGQAIAFNYKFNLAPGSYHTHVKILKYGGDELATGGYYTGSDLGTLTVQITPQ